MMISKRLFRGRRNFLSTFAGIPSDDNRVTAVLGGQWGDEGKGILSNFFFSKFTFFFRRRFRRPLSHTYLFILEILMQ